MFPLNDGIGESNILQNQFTAYLVTAAHRKNVQYLHAKSRRLEKEILLDIEENHTKFQVEQDMMPHLPLMDQLESEKLRQALKGLKEREIHILTMKVMNERSFQEIADETGLGYKTISSIYYRLIQKLRAELGGEMK